MIVHDDPPNRFRRPSNGPRSATTLLTQEFETLNAELDHGQFSFRGPRIRGSRVRPAGEVARV